MKKQQKSRTEYSAQNTVVAIIARILAIVSGFFVRVIFTHTLSQEYVGINGLFTDIISILSLSELGIETAITFSLYKPIAEEDIEKQKSIMKMYKFFYHIVAAIVLTLGLLIIPFMDYLIKDHDHIEHLILIYMMYLMSSVLSYFMVYKKTLIDAHQLSYIGVVYHTFFLLIQYIFQALVLVISHNFILYLSLLIICTLLNNFCLSLKAEKLYPFLKDKNVKPLLPEEKKDIFESIKAMLLHKIGNVLINNTDNLLLSSLIGTVVVGCYSNYYLIIGSIRQVMEQCFQGIAASVGNLGVTESRDRVKRIFDSSFFLGQWIYGMVSIAMYEAIDFFVGRSFGNSYVFDKRISLVLCINFYLLGMRQATLVFRDSMGLFRYDRYKSIAEAVLNLILSILLGKHYGCIGIFIGTSLSMILTSLWIEPFIFYKYKLKESCIPYFLRFAKYALITAALWFLEDKLCNYIKIDNWFNWFLRIFICVLITNFVYLIIYHRTAEFSLLLKKALNLLKTKLNKTHISNDFFKEEELFLLSLLAENLKNKNKENELISDNQNSILFNKSLSGEQWDNIYDMAQAHKVTALLGETIVEYNSVNLAVANKILNQVKICSLQNYHLLTVSKLIYDEFEKNNCKIVFLKGAATGFFYPIPELRKTGDVDFLLLDKSRFLDACNILENMGYRENKEQTSLHHIAFSSKEGIEIEMHLLMAEPFDNNHINDFIEILGKDLDKNVILRNIMGYTLPVLKDGYHAYELLLHMLQHFLRSGFGIKLLCDWVVLWSYEINQEDKDIYMKLVTDSKLKGFSDMVSLACCAYLGLDREAVKWMKLSKYNTAEFMREIIDAEEFGKSSKNRMVALRGNSLGDYCREFHHQMKLNYPQTGKHFIFWPFLWILTFLRFVMNNKKIRKTSFWAIMQSAGDRGKLIKKMKIFKE